MLDHPNRRHACTRNQMSCLQPLNPKQQPRLSIAIAVDIDHWGCIDCARPHRFRPLLRINFSFAAELWKHLRRNLRHRSCFGRSKCFAEPLAVDVLHTTRFKLKKLSYILLVVVGCA